MPAVSVTYLVKAAITLLFNEKTRKEVGWIIAAILSPLIVLFALLFAMLTDGAEHNNNAVALVFSNAPIGNVPSDYRQSIENMRESFSVIGTIINEVNTETEETSLDDIRVKAIFYALFYSEVSPQNINHSDFVSCFYYTEERTKTETAIDEYGVEYTYEVTYTVNIIHSDLLVVYQNISQVCGKKATNEDMVNANEIYIMQKHGDVIELPSDVPFVGIDGFVEPITNWQTAVSSEYGMRYHPTSGEFTMHYGIDFAKPQGTPIFAVLDGTVTVATYSDSFGYYIRVNHGGGFETIYAHCSKLLVSAGETVAAGDKIALVGTTGDSTGNHLHFETIFNGEKINPRAYLPIT